MNSAKPGLKKAALLFVLEILKSNSDSNGLDQTTIVDRLETEYGVKLNRETVGKNLDVLLDVYPDNIGFRLNNAKKRCGWYWSEKNSNDFDPSEVRLLLGVVECYGKLDARHKQDLLNRIAELNTDVEPDCVTGRLNDRIRRDNTYRLFYNIGLLGEAIAKNDWISFSKGIYTKDGGIIKASGDNARTHIVFPRSIVFKNNTYMLIAVYGNPDSPTIMHCSIDTMFDIEIIQNSQTSSNTIMQNDTFPFDVQKYLDEHLYMFSQDPQRTVIRVKNTPSCIRQIYEQFGLGVKGARQCPDGIHIDFIVNEPETPMVFWALQYSEMAEIIEPETLRHRIAEQITILRGKYCDE